MLIGKEGFWFLYHFPKKKALETQNIYKNRAFVTNNFNFHKANKDSMI